MKKNILLLASIACISAAQAQVGINVDSPKATLHVNASNTGAGSAEGIIAPSLTRAQLIAKDAQYGADQRGAFIYITTIDGTVSAKTLKVTMVGYHYFDGSIWQPFDYTPQILYLPSFNLPMTAVATGQTYDLYNQVYKKQFTKAGNTTWVSSNSLLTQIPEILAANQVDFVVTYYDATVITINSISAAGVLNYNVINTNPGDQSFINIVLVKK
ncbi:hypothetical protein [Dysgonomonas sp. GY617]|uniref:hypothetical protein n=1 Tax=Dysgonomonas sp. GY617 TaxID=2780420 RepID=UPI0018843BA1|nr:hypothetical protein [Dysgonomonas sp. GY617]MBF0574874.1 hypothetical protein [Dysgonomonas sp. GY617]